jgi:hypothetical protein
LTPSFPLSVRRARLLAVAWGLFLLALTSWPSPPEVPVVSSIPNFDKLVHAVLYGVEGFLLYFAIGWEPRGGGAPRRLPGRGHRGPAAEEDQPSFSWRRAMIVGAIMAVWGALDEIHQLWIPGRSCELADAVTDAVAGFLGGVVASRVSARRARET